MRYNPMHMQNLILALYYHAYMDLYVYQVCIVSSISFSPHPRCNIPVVVMGETGCGKTRLIRFMCDMIALSAGGGIDCVRNMLIMKVHA